MHESQKNAPITEGWPMFTMLCKNNPYFNPEKIKLLLHLLCLTKPNHETKKTKHNKTKQRQKPEKIFSAETNKTQQLKQHQQQQIPQLLKTQLTSRGL